MDIFSELKRAGLFDQDNRADGQTINAILSMINSGDTVDQERVAALLTSSVAGFEARHTTYLQKALNR